MHTNQSNKSDKKVHIAWIYFLNQGDDRAGQLLVITDRCSILATTLNIMLAVTIERHMLCYYLSGTKPTLIFYHLSWHRE